MQRLFFLNRGTSHKDVEFFSDKQKAKAERDVINGGNPAELALKGESMKVWVSLGPDHLQFDAHRGPKFTEKKRKRRTEA